MIIKCNRHIISNVKKEVKIKLIIKYSKIMIKAFRQGNSNQIKDWKILN